MVKIEPIPNAEIRCNVCNMLLGLIIDGEFEPSIKLEETWSRHRIYDIKDDGVPMYDYEFEIDLCYEHSEAFLKTIKKFKLKKAKVNK